LTSVLVEGEWSASRSCRFISWLRVRVPFGYGLGRPQCQCGRYGKVKNSKIIRGLNPEPSIVQPVDRHYVDCVTAPLYISSSNTAYSIIAVALNGCLAACVCRKFYTVISGKTFNVRFEVFTAVTTKNCVFWDVTPCGSCTNRRFGGT
jgi:hypothetical protein